MPQLNLFAISPLVAVAVCGLLLLLAAPFCKHRRGWLQLLSAIGILVAAGLSFTVLARLQTQSEVQTVLKAAFDTGASTGGWYAKSVVLDAYAIFFQIVFLIGLALTILISNDFLGNDPERAPFGGEFYALLFFATLGMIVMVAANDLLVFFLGLETLSIALYILAGFARKEEKSLEAAVKYFLLGAFASGFLLFGIALVYGAAATTNITMLAQTIAAEQHHPGLLTAGVVLLLIGFAFKAALVPFHQWTPDVYEGAPTPVTAFMSVGAKAAALGALLRVLQSGLSMPLPEQPWIVTLGSSSVELAGSLLPALWLLAVLTMVVGNIAAVAQTSLKRMLAYSSIAHAGYLLVGVMSVSHVAQGTRETLMTRTEGTAATGAASVLFYLLVYTFMNIGAFAWVELTGRLQGGDVSLDDCDGLAWKAPGAAAAMAVFMVSLAGLPPTAGFFAKFYVFREAVRFYAVNQNPMILSLVIIGVLASVVSVFYYLRVLVRLYMHEPRDEATPAAPAPRMTSFAMGLCAVMVLAIGLQSSGLWEWAVSSVMLR